ncbi:hypothetical protein RSOLAG1IB_11493 [Rhizoctonia solani AG-1 IB]|uniref:Uncharacterized protein n=1 Tax=Thanatephorus cucumeris (strain AG1-IB / isolate 7/3/14) TaxID=1108050 RepID=A0A0B7F877_THACB|nr:hypothetical protein RSOLAG1IB_11493 [Rhizoctonia solani AG-1 IB]
MTGPVRSKKGKGKAPVPPSHPRNLMETPNSRFAMWKAFQRKMWDDIAIREGREPFKPMVARKAYVRQSGHYNFARQTPGLSRYISYSSSPEPEPAHAADSGLTPPQESGSSRPTAQDLPCRGRSDRPVHSAGPCTPSPSPQRDPIEVIDLTMLSSTPPRIASSIGSPATSVAITSVKQAVTVAVTWLATTPFAPALLACCLARAVAVGITVHIAVIRVAITSVEQAITVAVSRLSATPLTPAVWC